MKKNLRRFSIFSTVIADCSRKSTWTMARLAIDSIIPQCFCWLSPPLIASQGSN